MTPSPTPFNHKPDAPVGWTQAQFYHAIEPFTLAVLDQRYWDFVETLPPALAQVAANQQIVTGEPHSSPMSSIAGLGFMVALPWLLQEAFPTITDAEWLDLGEAWVFLAIAVLLHDHLVDGQVQASVPVYALKQKFWDRAQRLLYTFIGDKQPFFEKRFAAYEQETADALRMEAAYRVTPYLPYAWADAWTIGAGKAALFKVIPCALVARSGQITQLAAWEQSMDYLTAGRQLLDDVGDYLEDLNRGHYTYPLVQAIQQLPKSPAPIPVDQIMELLAHSSICGDVLRQAVAWHQVAQEAVATIACRRWVHAIQSSMADCQTYHYGLLLAHIRKALHPIG